MNYFRLWLLLVISFAGVFGVFVNHDLLLPDYYGPGSHRAKSRASPSEIFVSSLLAGVVISTCVTLIHCGVEQLAKAASRRWDSAA